jgi:hypothetical protein
MLRDLRLWGGCRIGAEEGGQQDEFCLAKKVCRGGLAQKLTEELQMCEQRGTARHDAGDFKAAEPFLRRALVFSDRLYGAAAARTKQLWALRETNLDDLMRSTLRFAVGDQITVVAGEHKGATGTVKSLLLRHARAYVIATYDAQTVYAADEEVRLAEPR